MSDAECLLIYSVLHIKSSYCCSHGFLPYIGNPMVPVAIDQLEAVFLSCQPIRASSAPSPSLDMFRQKLAIISNILVENTLENTAHCLTFHIMLCDYVNPHSAKLSEFTVKR